MTSTFGSDTKAKISAIVNGLAMVIIVKLCALDAAFLGELFTLLN
jgi:hypothetical protein